MDVVKQEGEKMKIIDDVFLPEQANYIEDLLTSTICTWAYLPDSSGTIDEGQKFPSFSKPIYHEDRGAIDNSFFLRFEMISQTIAAKADVRYGDMLRIRCGMHLPNASWSGHHGVHVDQNNPHTVVIYYVNDTDGDTYFFDSDRETVINRIAPKKNTMVVFDGRLPHASSYPSMGERIIINFNFLPKIQYVSPRLFGICLGWIYV